MVQFGQYLLAHQVPGWENYYINYKSLKKTIKRYEGRAVEGSTEEQDEAIKIFSQLLDTQVERAVLFFLERQGQLAGKLQELRGQVDEVQTGSDTSSIPSIMQGYRSVATELLQLLQFMEINATGIRKILKKFDRRVGLRLGAKYLESRTKHPYSQLQQVFRQVGLGAMVGAILRNLGELHRLDAQRAPTLRRYSSFNLFARAQVPEYLAEEEPIMKEIEAAQAKLTKAVSYSSFVANELLLPKPLETLPGVPLEEDVEFHWWSLQLNQVNTFLYMVNYYIIVPTSDDYAEILRAPGSLCGVIIGSMPFCALVSALVYSKWSNRSYREPLYISTAVLIFGNFLYAAAYDFDAVWMLMAGRALAGLGGARAINRRYISDHVPLTMRTGASAAFVSASALGMAAGPAIAGVFNNLRVKLLGFTVNAVTSPGWLMAALWSIYLILLLLFFKEPGHKKGEDVAAAPPGAPKRAASKNARERVHLGGSGLITDGDHDLEQPLVQSESSSERDDDDDDTIRPVESFEDLARELTPAVQVLLAVYFMIKLAQEVLVSESSLVTKYYFDWNIYNIGLFLAILGATVLPVSALVGNYISNIFEDRLVLIWTMSITAVGVVGIFSFSPLLPYTHTQYVVAAIVIYVAANVTEGVNMALLSRVMSPALARGTFNCGLLSTEAGTFARVVGDGLISATGYVGTQYVLNATMAPVLLTAIASIWWTRVRYYSLF